MRHTLVILATLVMTVGASANSSSSTAAPGGASTAVPTSIAKKDVMALMKESQSLREMAAKENTASGKLKKLKDFEASLTTTIKAYEKSSPTEGSDAEEKVVKFSFRFEPVFELSKKKFVKSDCDKARGRIELEDQSGKSEGSPLSANAEEALKWLDVVCK